MTYHQKYRLRRKAIIDGLKESCSRCGFDNPLALEWHHKDPTTKSFKISSGLMRSWDKIMAEIDKCEIICANCHAIEHNAQYVRSN